MVADGRGVRSRSTPKGWSHQEPATSYPARSKSSMRIPRQQHEQQRPRPISAGRALSGDPNSVTKAILDLRDKRSRSSSRSASRGKVQQTLSRSSSHSSNENYPKRPPGASPSRRRSSGPISPRSAEEDRASSSLKQAEVRIDGLLQELEDLRFLQELDETEANASPPQKVLGAMRSGEKSPVPPIVRAISPSRNRGLPPPPPAPNAAEYSLSPRKIAKMDRTTLELETQTLVRKLQVLAQEKSALESAVEMYELTLQDTNAHSEKIRRLETELKQVSGRLRQAKVDVETVHDRVATDYEARLRDSNEKLCYVQKQAETLQRERDRARKEADKRKTEYSERKAKLKDELQGERDSRQQRESLMELQLSEMSQVLDEMQDEMKLKEEEVESLQAQLAEAQTKASTSKKEKDQTYEVRISSLQDQLQLMEEKYKTASEESERMSSKMTHQGELLEKQKTQSEEQMSLVGDMTKRLESVHKEYREKFDELKEAYEAKEKRRLSEMVENQTGEVKDYERRMQSLQEQLTLQTDRHHEEIRQKDRESNEKLESLRSTLKREAESEYLDRLFMAEEQLSVAKSDLASATEEIRRLEREVQDTSELDKLQQEVRELRREKSSHDQEYSRMKDKVENATLDLVDKDTKLQELSTVISDMRSKSNSRVREMEKLQRKQLEDHEHRAKSQADEFAAVESKLRSDLSKAEATAEELRTKMSLQASDLQDELDSARSSLTEAKHFSQKNEMLRERVGDLQSKCERLHTELAEERSRNETNEAEMRLDIAKLEGKLRAGDASVKAKRETISDLEDQLRRLSDESSSSTQDLVNELQSMQSELRRAKQELEAERISGKEKDERISEVSSEMETLQSRLESQASQLDRQAKSLDDLMDERCENLDALDRERELIRQLESQKEELRLEKNGLEAERDSILEKQQEMSSQLLTLEEQLSAASNSVVSARAEASEKAKAVEDQKAMEQELQLRLTDMKALLSEKNEEIVDRDNQLLSLRSLLDKSKADLVRHESQISELSEDKQRLLKEVDSERRRVRDHSVALSDLEDRLVTSDGRNREVVARLHDAESQVSTKQMEHDALLLELEELRSSASELRSLAQSREDQIRELEAAKQRADGDVEKLNGEVAAREKKASRLKKEQEQLTSLVGVEQAEVKTKNEKLAKLTEERDELLKVIESQKATLEARAESIESLEDEQKKLSKKMARLEESEEKLREVEAALASTEDEKIKLLVELTNVSNELEDVQTRLSEYEDQDSQVEEILKRKVQEVSHASQAITELQEQLDSERKAKQGFLERLTDMEADLEMKEHQLSRLPKLQSQLKEMIKGREELQAKLGRIEIELDRKEKLIETAAEKQASAEAELKSKQEEHTRSREAMNAQLRAITAELEMKSERIERQLPTLQARLRETEQEKDDLKIQLRKTEAEFSKKQAESAMSMEFTMEHQEKVEELTKAKACLEAKLDELQEEHEERERQVKLSSERQSNQLLDLRMKVEELSTVRSVLQRKLAEVETYLEEKDAEIKSRSSQRSSDLADLRRQLSETRDAKHELQRRLDSMQRDASRRERESSSIESDQLVDLQKRLDQETKEKRSLKLSVGDVEAELERKEKQVRDLLERYSKQVSDLEYKLADETRRKEKLEKDIESMREAVSDHEHNETSLREVHSLRTRLAETEKELEEEKVRVSGTRSSNDGARLEDLEDKLKKANTERAEIISALEGLIGEVQSRDEEIESLASVLQKRDEELEHAKLIATKALASAQDLKNRYRDQGSGRQKEMADKMADLNSNLQYLSTKNENLQRRTTKLERELRLREAECADLKSKLRSSEVVNEDEKKDSLEQYMGRNSDREGFKLMDDGFPSFESPLSSQDSGSQASSQDLGEAMSTRSGDLGNASGWLPDVGASTSEDSDEHTSFAGIRTEPGSASSRRAIERDALRKYVRKRYLKSKGSL